MTTQPDILCIGSVLWDVIGRSRAVMRQGSDVPGRITRIPGGVCLNIAMTLAQFGLSPALLTAVGRDAEGDDLVAACRARGLHTDWIYRSDDLPTDRYMAVEGANGLIAAIADAHSLEAAGAKILNPMLDGPLGTDDAPWSGAVALDGNLTVELLADIAESAAFAHADLRIAPASPGKAERLAPFLKNARGTLYVNREEAGSLCQRTFANAEDAAKGVLDRGAHRVLVTDGGASVCEANGSDIHVRVPPQVLVTRITGAGDTFMAAHIAAETRGEDADQALGTALTAAATYVSGGTP